MTENRLTSAPEYPHGSDLCAVTTGECPDCEVGIEVVGHCIPAPELVREHEDLPCVLCGRPVATVAVLRLHSECS